MKFRVLPQHVGLLKLMLNLFYTFKEETSLLMLFYKICD